MNKLVNWVVNSIIILAMILACIILGTITTVQFNSTMGEMGTALGLIVSLVYLYSGYCVIVYLMEND